MSTTRSGEEVLDQHTLRKLKQHNRAIHQQKEQEAVALRRKLEQWKEEKKQKKKQVPKKMPFVTSVRKLSLRPTQGQPPDKACPKVPVTRKPACGPAKSRTGVKLPVSSKPARVLVKSQANVAKPKQAKKPAEKGALCKERSDKLPLPSKHRNAAGKENEAAANCATPSAGSAGAEVSSGADLASSSGAVSDCFKLSASEITTPLSRRSLFGMRHVVVNLTERVEEGQGRSRPLSLSDELQAASCAAERIAAESPSESTDVDDSKKTCHEEGSVGRSEGDSANKASEISAPASTRTRVTPRDSLTAQFRKFKPQNKNAVPSKAVLAASRASTAKSASSLASVRPTKAPLASNPPRSILKRKSCRLSLRSSAQGVSPLLPDAPSSKSRRKTTGAGACAAELGADGGKVPGAGTQGAAALSAHVTFAAGMGTAGGEGASFRKTPGKCKAQEYMRSRLNEWLVAKGHTPSGMRHAGCFGCEARACRQQTPRSQVKASMSVEQLSRQESTLAREDTQTTPSPRRLPPALTPPPPFRLPLTPYYAPRARTALSSPQGSANLSHDSSEAIAMAENGDGSLEVAHLDYESDESEGVQAEDHGKEDGIGSAEDDSMEVEASPSSGRAALVSKTVGEDQLDIDVQKCLTSIESGSLSAEAALEWLNLVSEACDEARRHVGWYRCQVAALKISADEDALLAVFEQAIINNAQPAVEMAQLLTDTMRELLAGQSSVKRGRRSTASRPPGSTRRPHADHRTSHQPDVQPENMFQSTTVKYSVVEVTPFKKRRRETDTDAMLVPVVTPVRRSARYSSSRAAAASEGRLPRGTPHEYSALAEVPSEEKERMLFQPNRALEPLLGDESPETRRLSLYEAV